MGERRTTRSMQDGVRDETTAPTAASTRGSTLKMPPVLRQPVIRAGEWRETRASSETKGELDHERARVGHEIGIGAKAATARRHRLAIHIRVVRVGMGETCADQAARRS